jgi:hypothetical protein
MYSVSNNYKNSISSDSRVLNCYTIVGAQTFYNDTIESINFEDTVNPDDVFAVGTVSSAYLEITLLNVTGNFDGVQVKPFIGVDITGAGDFEYVPLGVFNVEETTKNKGSITLKCFDNMIKTESTYTTSLTYPATLTAVMNEICTKTGITFSGTLPNYSVPKPEAATYREVVGFIAGVCGGFAKFNRSGVLNIKSYAFSSVRTIDSTNYFDLNKEDGAYTIGKVTIRDESSETSYSNGSVTSSTMELIINSPWASSAIASDIYTKLNGISFIPVEMPWQGDPALDVGDWVTINEYNASPFTTIMTEVKLTFSGGMTADFSSKCEGKTKNQYNTNPQVPGIKGPPGKDGQTLYTWIKYADSPTTGMSDLPDGKKYIGFAYNKTTAVESSIYTDYTWSLIEGPQGSVGPTGATLYTWLKYADTPTTGMSDSPTGKTYMGIAYNKSTSTESTTYSDYSWSLIKGDTGATGPTGPTLYTWIKYANDSIGTGMSDTPTGKTYIGIAYNKTTATKSTNAGDYTWSLFQGPQGVIGPPGDDGLPTYTWIKYADDAAGAGMSDSPTGKRFLGLAHNKTTATESTTATDYTWSPLYDGVIVGGRNLMTDSMLQRILVSNVSNGTLVKTASSPSNLAKVTWSGTGTNFGIQHAVSDRTMSYKLGKKYVLSFDVRGTVTNLNYTYMMRNSAEGTNSAFPTKTVSLSTTTWTRVVMYKDGPFTSSTGYLLIGSTDVVAGRWFEVRDVMMEEGNIDTGYNPAPEENILEGVDYNGVAFTAANGVEVTSAKNKVTMNATKGIEIKRTTDNKLMFTVDATTGDVTFGGSLNGAIGTFSGTITASVIQSAKSGGSAPNWMEMDSGSISAYVDGTPVGDTDPYSGGLDFTPIWDGVLGKTGVDWRLYTNLGSIDIESYRGGDINIKAGSGGLDASSGNGKINLSGVDISLLGNADIFKLIGSTHVFQEFFNDGVNRSGWFGYGSAGVTVLQANNALGDIWLTPKSGSKVVANGNFEASSYADFASGLVTITPVANTPTSIAVSFGKTFSAAPKMQVSVNTSGPGTAIKGISFTNVTTTGCTLWINRIDTGSTQLSWFASNT